MKKLILLFLFFTTVVSAQFNGPKIVVPQPKYNFGDINEGAIVKHKFVIYNKGGADLTIKRVKASCGCTAAEPVKKILAPFDSTSIDVTFNSNRRRGRQRKHVYIFSDDPERPELRLSFTANIISKSDGLLAGEIPILKLSEYNHNFGTVKEGEKKEAVIKVSNIGSGTLKIKNIRTSCGCTAALLNNKSLKPNESDKLKIIFDSKNMEGEIARTITLTTNDPKNPNKVIVIIAKVIKE